MQKRKKRKKIKSKVVTKAAFVPKPLPQVQKPKSKLEQIVDNILDFLGV